MHPNQGPYQILGGPNPSISCMNMYAMRANFEGLNGSAQPHDDVRMEVQQVDDCVIEQAAADRTYSHVSLPAGPS